MEPGKAWELRDCRVLLEGTVSVLRVCRAWLFLPCRELSFISVAPRAHPEAVIAEGRRKT